MILDFVPVRENQASRILPRPHRTLRVFLILFDRTQPETAVSGGYAVGSG